MKLSINYSSISDVRIIGDHEDPSTYREPTIGLSEGRLVSGGELWINFDDCDDLLGFIEELQKHLAVCLCRRNKALSEPVG